MCKRLQLRDRVLITSLLFFLSLFLFLALLVSATTNLPPRLFFLYPFIFSNPVNL